MRINHTQHFVLNINYFLHMKRHKFGILANALYLWVQREKNTPLVLFACLIFVASPFCLSLSSLYACQFWFLKRALSKPDRKWMENKCLNQIKSHWEGQGVVRQIRERTALQLQVCVRADLLPPDAVLRPGAV